MSLKTYLEECTHARKLRCSSDTEFSRSFASQAGLKLSQIVSEASSEIDNSLELFFWTLFLKP